MNQCGECNKNFRSTSAFDRHRVGEHGPEHGQRWGTRRRCLSEEEMLQAGMQMQQNTRTWASQGPEWVNKHAE
jgi:hypothetical protein